MLKIQGFQAPGRAPEMWVGDTDKVIALPQDFTFEQRALLEPVSVAVHAVAHAGSVHQCSKGGEKGCPQSKNRSLMYIQTFLKH